MEKEQQIQKLLALAKVEANAGMREKLIYTLYTYGEAALPALFDLMDVEANNEVKEFILDRIADMEKKGPPQTKSSMRM